MRHVKRILKFAWRTAKIFFAVLAVFTASLFFREQRLPRFAVDWICGRISTREFAVRCDGASFGFRHGLRISGIKVHDLRRKDSLENTVATAKIASIDFLKREIALERPVYMRLPDSYYEPSDEPPQPPVVDFDIPDFAPFSVSLESPSILGISPKSAKAVVSASSGVLRFEDVKIEMQDQDRHVKLDASAVLDLPSQTLEAEASGEVRYGQIRPVLEAMDVPCAIPYVESFTGVVEPIPAKMELKARFPDGSLEINIHGRPVLGEYNGVPMDRGEGTIAFSTRIEGEARKNRLDLEIPYVLDRAGRSASGRIEIESSVSHPVRVGVSGRSSLGFSDALEIIDVIPRDVFYGLKCDTPPDITVSGVVCTEKEDFKANDLKGKAFLRHGTLDGFRVNDLSCEFALAGDKLSIDSAATGKTGGKADWKTEIDLNRFEDGPVRFSIDGSYKSGSLEELADVLKFDLGEKHGTVDWDMTLSGLAFAGGREARSLNGKGRFKISDGHLAQMKLFAGLTELLAEKIPGVSFLVNQTQASADFTIKDGVFASDNVFVEGGLVSIKGWGTYDMATDNLDFTVRAQFLKNESIMGKIVHPVTFPVTKLLLEFKVDGPIDDPDWKYIKPLDRLF